MRSPERPTASRRLQATQARLNEAARLYIAAVHAKRQEEYGPEALGFEFTLEQIEVRAIELEPDLFADWAVEQDSYCDVMASILGPEHQE